ncbi:hypothetical protein [Methylohalobius crimeensis]|uniref:hypothetical protein n=1 Tax=Methylohalobius crimeensis TaxID=244365 RepID=UPI0003B74F50|nr:hypothetical protein [Methylohalobius crimeensis]
MSDEKLTLTEFARRIGVRQSYASQLKKKGRLVMEGRKVLYRASLERMEATRDPSKITPKPPSGTPAPEVQAIRDAATPPADEASSADDEDLGAASPNYQSARAKREHFNAEMARLEYEKAVGQLVEIDRVREVILNATTTLRTKLEQMAESIAGRVQATRDEAEGRAVVIEEVEHALGDLSRAFEQLSNDEARGNHHE